MADPEVIPPPVAPPQVVDESGLVNMVARTGHVVRVRPDQVEIAQAQGYAPADMPTVQEAILREDNSGLGSMIAAGAAGVARGVSLGLSDVALGALGAQEKLEALKKYNPVTSLGGEVVGNIAGLGFASPVKGATMLGRAAGAGVERAIGKGVASAVTTGVTEGIAFGAGQAVSEAALGDKYDQLGELLASEIGLGALMGGGAGLALSLASKGVHAVTSPMRRGVQEGVAGAEDFQRLAEGAFGTSTPELGQAVEKASWLERKAAAVAGWGRSAEQKAYIKNLTRSPDVAGRAVNAKQALDDLSDGLTEQLSEVHKALNLNAERFMGKMKRAEVAASIAEDANRTASMDLAEQAIRDNNTLLNRLSDATAGYSDEGIKIKNLWSKQRRLESMLGDPRLAGNDLLTEVYMGLDDMKREAGKRAYALSRKGGNSLRGISTEQRATRDALISQYKTLLGHLENPTWGTAAVKQRAINKPWSNLIDAEVKAGAHSFEAGFTASKLVGEFGESAAVVTKEKVRDWLNHIGVNAGESEKLAAARAYLDNSEALVKAAAEHLDLPPAIRAKAEAFPSMTAKVRESLEHAVGVAQDGAQYTALAGSTTGGGVIKALVGYGLGGLPGGIAGHALDAVTNPKKLINTLAMVNQITGRGSKRIGKALEQVAGKAVDRARLGAGAVAAQTALKYESASRERNQTREFDRRAQVLGELASMPKAPSQLAQAAFHDIARAAPSVTAAAAVSLERQVSYLQSVLPKLGMWNPFAARPDASNTEKRQFNKRARSAEDPAALLEKIVSGKASLWDIQATAAVAPATYGDMQSSVLAMMSNLAGDGKMLPYEQRIQLDMALGLGVEPMTMPQMIQDMQAAFMPQPQVPEQQTPPSDAQMQKASAATMTRDEKLLR